MEQIGLKEAENEAGLAVLRDEIDKSSLTVGYAGTIHPQYSLPSNWVPMGKGTKGRPKRDDIVILQDRYRDELQCRKCGGKGHSQIQCRLCGGTGRDTVRGETRPCPDCISSDFDSPALPKSTGFLPCSECRGTGQSTAAVTGLVTSTDKQLEPSTGIIMGVGRMVTEWSLGQRVLYSRFAGVEYECEGRKWRVMKETYPIMEIVGKGDVKTRE